MRVSTCALAFASLFALAAGPALANDELLKLELQDLKAFDYNLSLTGFDAGELEKLLLPAFDEQAENAVPEPPEDPVAQTGDLWILGPPSSRNAVGRHGLLALLPQRRGPLLAGALQQHGAPRDQSGLRHPDQRQPFGPHE